MRMSTIDAALHFLSRVQLLFVDADHSYEGVHADLDAWTPKLNEGGFIVLHDFGTWPGVTRAAADLLDEGYCHHSQSGSALVLQKTADAPEILK
jgi:hypothetical protein